MATLSLTRGIVKLESAVLDAVSSAEADPALAGEALATL